MINPRQRSKKISVLLALIFCLPAQLFFVESVARRNTTCGQSVVARGPRYNHLVDDFAKEFPGIEGQGITALILGSDAVRNTHKEFQNAPDRSAGRVTVVTKKKIGESTTAMAGIMAAKGLTPEAKGMAPYLKLLSHDSDDDLTKLRRLATQARVAIDTRGTASGWIRGRPPEAAGFWLWAGDEKISKDEDSKFGKYVTSAAALDSILNDFPTLLVFTPAGSSRDEGPEMQPIVHYLTDTDGKPRLDQARNETRRMNGWDRGGLDTLSGRCIAKNAICIGTIDDISFSRPITIEDYSGWGPTDDGRIKPDLVASGHNVFSTSAKDDTAYQTASGSGMATAAASGISALMVQLYRKARGGPQQSFPTSADIKAVLIHTATDAGARGPDPKFGWGSINARFAGQVIAQKNAAGKFLHTIYSGTITPNSAKQYLLASTGDRIRITLVWIDPEAPHNAGGLDDSTRTLQNDLDVRLISPAGTIYFPYTLDPTDPHAPARSDGPNRVDNVEMIDVATNTGRAGWKLQVTAHSLKASRLQRFVIVVSGLSA